LYVAPTPNNWPVGRFTFQFCSAVSISLIPIRWAYSLLGSTCTRTAYFAAPNTCTCDTPLTIEMRGASWFSA